MVKDQTRDHNFNNNTSYIVKHLSHSLQLESLYDSHGKEIVTDSFKQRVE